MSYNGQLTWLSSLFVLLPSTKRSFLPLVWMKWTSIPLLHHKYWQTQSDVNVTWADPIDGGGRVVKKSVIVGLKIHIHIIKDLFYFSTRSTWTKQINCFYFDPGFDIRSSKPQSQLIPSDIQNPFLNMLKWTDPAIPSSHVMQYVHDVHVWPCSVMLALAGRSVLLSLTLW